MRHGEKEKRKADERCKKNGKCEPEMAWFTDFAYGNAISKLWMNGYL